MFQVLSHFERCPGFDKKRYVKKIAGGVTAIHFVLLNFRVMMLALFVCTTVHHNMNFCVG